MASKPKGGEVSKVVVFTDSIVFKQHRSIAHFCKWEGWD